jgi:hypothetical protein
MRYAIFLKYSHQLLFINNYQALFKILSTTHNISPYTNPHETPKCISDFLECTFT